MKFLLLSFALACFFSACQPREVAELQTTVIDQQKQAAFSHSLAESKALKSPTPAFDKAAIAPNLVWHKAKREQLANGNYLEIVPLQQNLIKAEKPTTEYLVACYSPANLLLHSRIVL